MGEAIKSKIYQWLDEENKVEKPAEPPRRTYDEKLVAFIDILGIRSKIRAEENDAEEILIIMGKLQSYVESACEELVADDKLNYLQLGDSFIIVADLDCMDKLCEILSIVQWKVLVYSKMLLRGALTAGKVSMSDDSKIIIGPAYIDAFDLESENAIFPRILIANEIQQFISSKDIKFEYIVEDNDKFRYLDFINYIIKTKKLNTVTLEHILNTEGIVLFLKKSYQHTIKNNKHVAQKYGWMIAKLASYNINIILK
jgi:hypothetical protein